MKIRHTLFALLFLSISPLSFAEEIRAQEYRINPIQHPEKFMEALVRLSTSTEGKALIGAVATYFGTDPKLVGLLQAVPQGEWVGHDHRGRILVEDGYVFCKANMEIKSVTQGSHFDIKSNAQGLHYYASLPKKKAGGGRSWADATIELVAVKRESRDRYVEAGKCKPYDAILLYCKSNGCKGRR